MRRRHGFTLVELLVVIAIIAVLVSIMIPALAAARQAATGSVCLSNQRALILAYMLYIEDNDDWLVDGWSTPDVARHPDTWVHNPTTADGYIYGWPTAGITMEDRFRGIRKGALWEYNRDYDVYHCPGDRRHIEGTVMDQVKPGRPEAYRMWRTYSIQGGLHGEPAYSILKYNDIRQPGSTYVFVEEDYKGQYHCCNNNSWVLCWGDNMDAWCDPLAPYHNDRSTLSFADGHARIVQWQDERTIEYAWSEDCTTDMVRQPDNPDLKFMISGYGIRLPRFLHNP